MNEKILILALTIKVIWSSHFFGGSIFWKPLNQNLTGNIDIIFQYRFYYDNHRYSCKDYDILTNKLIGNNEVAIYSTLGANFQVESGVYCTDYSETYHWSGGQRSELITLDQSISMIEASFKSGNWISLVYGGGMWELRVKINLSKRRDNNKTNYSPISLMSPLIVIPLNYTSVIKIPTKDPDDDVIKCRWSSYVLNECGGVCNAVPDAILDEDNCTITFTPEIIGYYVVAIQIEDYYNNTNNSDLSPLSSVPLQFLLYVENRTIVEEDSPIEFYYITPDDDSSYNLQYNETLNGQIVINSSSQVTELVTLSPMGLSKTKINIYNNTLDLWYVNFSWTHLETGQEGLNLFCFQAKNIKGQSTELRCINLIGGITPRKPKPISSSQFSTLPLKYTLTTTNGTKLEENQNWIIALSISLGIMVLLIIMCACSLLLFLKCFKKKKNKVHNDSKTELKTN